MPTDSAVNAPRKPQARSRVSNGKTVVQGVDGRSVWVRRMRDLIALFSDDLGGDERLTEMQRALVRRAATLTVELERAEASFANAGAADPVALTGYQTCANSLRRLLESLGLPKHMSAVKEIEADLVPPPKIGFRLAAPVEGGEAPLQFHTDDEVQLARRVSLYIVHAISTGTLVDEVTAKLAIETGLGRVVAYVGNKAQLGPTTDEAVDAGPMLPRSAV